MKNISGHEMTLPGSDSPGGSVEAVPPGAGEAQTTRPRSSARNRNVQFIEQSHDVVWLKRLVADADQPIAERQAAEKRLRKLVRRPKL